MIVIISSIYTPLSLTALMMRDMRCHMSAFAGAGATYATWTHIRHWLRVDDIRRHLQPPLLFYVTPCRCHRYAMRAAIYAAKEKSQAARKSLDTPTLHGPAPATNVARWSPPSLPSNLFYHWARCLPAPSRPQYTSRHYYLRYLYDAA